MGALISLLILAAAAPPTKAKPVEPPPIVRTHTAPPPIIVTPSYPRWRFQQWSVLDMGDSTLASTKNASESAFGVICGKDCVWFVNFQKECEKGADYPAMINGPSGSFAIQLRCYHYDKLRLLTYVMSDASVDALAEGGEIGFAFPLDDGKFGVSRFSLAGSAEAVWKALDLIIAKRNVRQEGLRDFTI